MAAMLETNILALLGGCQAAVKAMRACGRLSEKLKQLLGVSNEVARAVLFAVTQPIDVNIADIVVWPPKAMTF